MIIKWPVLEGWRWQTQPFFRNQYGMSLCNHDLFSLKRIQKRGEVTSVSCFSFQRVRSHEKEGGGRSPARMSGMAFCWISLGDVMDMAVSAETRSGCTPSEEKVGELDRRVLRAFELRVFGIPWQADRSSANDGSGRPGLLSGQ
jgi:hypothetical protein